MEKKTKKEIVAKIEVICYSNNECDFNMEGERNSMIPALAALLADKSEENDFHHMMNIAIAVVLEKDKMDRKKAAVKKKAKKAV
jgi:hypothetical protein